MVFTVFVNVVETKRSKEMIKWQLEAVRAVSAEKR